VARVGCPHEPHKFAVVLVVQIYPPLMKKNKVTGKEKEILIEKFKKARENEIVCTCDKNSSFTDAFCPVHGFNFEEFDEKD
jgi:hypothetical protein